MNWGKFEWFVWQIKLWVYEEGSIKNDKTGERVVFQMTRASFWRISHLFARLFALSNVSLNLRLNLNPNSLSDIANAAQFSAHFCSLALAQLGSTLNVRCSMLILNNTAKSNHNTIWQRIFRAVRLATTCCSCLLVFLSLFLSLFVSLSLSLSLALSFVRSVSRVASARRAISLVRLLTWCTSSGKRSRSANDRCSRWQRLIWVLRVFADVRSAPLSAPKSKRAHLQKVMLRIARE